MNIFNYNTDKNLIKDIKPSKFEQSITTKDITVSNKSEIISNDLITPYNSIEECIISEYDERYLCNSDEVFIKNVLLELSNQLDDNYTAFRYNKKVIRKQEIENGFQKLNTLSNIIYLSDTYKTNIHLYINNNSYKLNPRNYVDNITIKYTNKKYIKVFDNSNSIEVDLSLKFPFINNIKNITTTRDVYNRYLQPISKYTISELQEISKVNKIDIYDNAKKKKTKKILYDEINILNI